MKHWKLLHTGTAWDLCNPNPADVHPLDIAVPLSRIPRWTGHGRRVITVAEHCVHVSRFVYEMTDGDLTAAAQGLLHDAAESITGDIPTPIKRLVPALREVEKIQLDAILTRFDLPTELHPAIKAGDRVLMASEAMQDMPHPPHPFYDEGDNFVRIQFWTEDEARNEFLTEGQTLGLW